MHSEFKPISQLGGTAKVTQRYCASAQHDGIQATSQMKLFVAFENFYIDVQNDSQSNDLILEREYIGMSRVSLQLNVSCL